MTLKIRRGTNDERMTVTPEVGEPVWTTDTDTLYIGDGETAGGVAVSGSGSVTVQQTKQQGAFTVSASATIPSTSFDAAITTVSPHHLLVWDGLLLVETVDYNITGATRNQVVLVPAVQTALVGLSLQLINFVTSLA